MTTTTATTTTTSSASNNNGNDMYLIDQLIQTNNFPLYDYFYKYDVSNCLINNKYQISIDNMLYDPISIMTTNTIIENVLLSIPQCDISLSYINNKQIFYIDSVISNMLSSSSSKSLVCRNECNRRDRLLIPLSLYAPYMEGWVSSFYSVHTLKEYINSKDIMDGNNINITGLIENSNISFWLNTSMSSGFLEWDQRKETNICISAVPMCYLVLLLNILIK
jgi:hypothetical protein